jgi:hypothetical protein
VTWVVCGNLPETGGCYGAGSFAPFGHVGAMVEGYATTIGDSHQVTLPLVGGSGVRCSMAANSGFLAIGTDQSTQAVLVTKGSYKLQSILGFSNSPTVTSITTDAYGYISVTFGGGNVIPGFVTIGPAGDYQDDGGGEAYMLSTGNGLSTKDVAPYPESAAAKLAARPVTLHATTDATR